jgi:hypothetical protein
MSFIEERPEVNEVYAKLIKARREFAVYRKDGKGNVGGRSYNYATLEDILQAIKPSLDAYDLFLSQPVRYMDGRYFVETLLFDSEGNTLELGVTPIISKVEMTRKDGTPYVKEDAQTLGSGMTYARRYGLVSAFGLISDEDDDGAMASGVDPKLENKRRAVTELGKACIANGYTVEEVTGALNGVKSTDLTMAQAIEGEKRLKTILENAKKGQING